MTSRENALTNKHVETIKNEQDAWRFYRDFQPIDRRMKLHILMNVR